MSIFINPEGNSTLGIGLCARCSRKFPLEKLSPDRNSPGLMVCEDDNDQFDPYRLPPRQPDNLVLPFMRPDIPLSVPDIEDDFAALATEDLLAGVETETTNQGIKVEE